MHDTIVSGPVDCSQTNMKEAVNHAIAEKSHHKVLMRLFSDDLRAVMT